MAIRSGTVDPACCCSWKNTPGCRPPNWPPSSNTAPACSPWAAPSASSRPRRRAAGDADAALAIGVYLHRLRAAIAAALAGLDVLVFTGGVGEN
jgi:acetate kinase